MRLQEIADRQGISEKYLEGIVVKLSRAGDLVSARGKGGGYRLSRAPEAYTVLSILERIEGKLAPVSCLEQQPVRCSRAPDCATLPLWEGAAGAHRGVSWERHAPRPHGAAHAGENWGRRPRFLTLDRNRRQTIIVEETRAGRPCAVRPQHRGGQNT